MTPCVIFAIDNGGDLNTRARFLRHLDTLRAMGKLKHPEEVAEGVAKAFTYGFSLRYRVATHDYLKHVQPHGWVNAQPGVITVGHDWRGQLETPDLKPEQAKTFLISALSVNEPTLTGDDGWYTDPCLGGMRDFTYFKYGS